MATDAGGRPVYRVRRGDNLSLIARRNGIQVADLRRWNDLAGDIIRPGQSLYVGAESTNDAYKVVRGDTLYSIARRFGISAEEIARRNNISLSSTLLTGMELRIPQSVD